MKNIIVGATGQVGSLVAKALKAGDFPVKAAVRNADKILDKPLRCLSLMYLMNIN